MKAFTSEIFFLAIFPHCFKRRKAAVEIQRRNQEILLFFTYSASADWPTSMCQMYETPGIQRKLRKTAFPTSWSLQCWKKDTGRVTKSSKRYFFPSNKSDRRGLEIGTWTCRFDGKNLRALPAQSSTCSKIQEERSPAGNCRVNGEFGCEESRGCLNSHQRMRRLEQQDSVQGWLRVASMKVWCGLLSHVGFPLASLSRLVVGRDDTYSEKFLLFNHMRVLILSISPFSVQLLFILTNMQRIQSFVKDF